jgi:hypothetical protein
MLNIDAFTYLWGMSAIVLMSLIVFAIVKTTINNYNSDMNSALTLTNNSSSSNSSVSTDVETGNNVSTESDDNTSIETLSDN